MREWKHPTNSKLAFVLSESDELIRIFFSSIQTAKKNALAERRRSSVECPSGKAA
jgi:hypothetical protein